MLSAGYGSNYCVIDVPRLSAFHAYYNPDHPMSASPNINSAFTVPIKVFEFNSTSGTSVDIGIPAIVMRYYDRNPTVPCWQVYPY